MCGGLTQAEVATSCDIPVWVLTASSSYRAQCRSRRAHLIIRDNTEVVVKTRPSHRAAHRRRSILDTWPMVWCESATGKITLCSGFPSKKEQCKCQDSIDGKHQ